MKLTKSQMSILRNALGDCVFTLFPDYSGRSMYGRTCFGFSTEERGAELKLAQTMIQHVIDDADEVLEDADIADGLNELVELLDAMADCACTDSLGRGTIYYYTQLEWDDTD